jgi:cell division septal protein FtsQ
VSSVPRRPASAASATPAVTRPLHPAALPPLTSGRTSANGSKRRKRLRDSETTRSRVKVKRAGKNRRRINVPRILLGWATAALVVECVAAALFSPRLWVKSVLVEGTQSIPAQTIMSHIKLGDQENIVRLPVKQLRVAVSSEPEVETVEIRRDFLHAVVHVVVKERTPWACVQTPDKLCYIIDQKLVPFQVKDIPKVGLPLLKLSEASGKVPLGKPMTAPGLTQVSRCLTWARGMDFPLDAVTIDSEGKLCLNRAGGARFLLGSGQDLDRKLKSLEMLLEQRAELRSATDVAYVNLLAYDAPAVRMRPVSHSAASADADNGVTVREIGALH